MTALRSRLALLASFGLLVACGDKGSDTDNGPVDADGDGYDATEDCDDDNANVFPGAPDSWYDGLDADCAGNDDYDADGDGVRSSDYGGADCDDSDPDISPTATEVWYDGVDQDCRGDDDYDADVDGFQSAEHVDGGLDCDDSDPDIWPGAVDTWYDGVDSNCDGASDYDADEDGYDADAYGGTDCDDADAAVHPDADEVWYDGIDEDCDGASDYDADGDGWDSDDYGGTDCQDDDPDAWAGADEQIDGHDTDCDGKADDFAVGEGYEGEVIWGDTGDASFGAALAVADADGDGLDDAAVVQLADGGTSTGGLGFVGIYEGATLASGSATSASADAMVLSGALDGPIGAVAWLPDMDGDGAMELLVGVPDAARGAGAVALVTSAEYAMNPAFDEAARLVEGGADETGVGEVVALLGDLDGDGVDEFGVGSPDNGDVGGAWVFLGSDFAAATTATTRDAATAWSGAPDSGSEVGAAMVALGDIDGDGYDDYALGDPGRPDGAGTVALILGGTLAPTGDPTTDGWMTIEGNSDGDALGRALAAGDIDGDGALDLVIGAPYESTQAGEVHVVLHDAFAAGGFTVDDVATVSYVGDTNFGRGGTAVATGGDVDGDGQDDLLVGGPGESAAGSYAGNVWLVISGETGNRALANADAALVGTAVDDQAGTAVGLGDVDGDGLADLLFTAPGADLLGGEGALFVAYSGY